MDRRNFLQGTSALLALGSQLTFPAAKAQEADLSNGVMPFGPETVKGGGAKPRDEGVRATCRRSARRHRGPRLPELPRHPLSRRIAHLVGQAIRLSRSISFTAASSSATRSRSPLSRTAPCGRSHSVHRHVRLRSGRAAGRCRRHRLLRFSAALADQHAGLLGRVPGVPGRHLFSRRRERTELRAVRPRPLRSTPPAPRARSFPSSANSGSSSRSPTP